MVNLILPIKSPVLRERLECKLAEYEERKKGKGKAWEHWAPSKSHALSSTYRDACYKSGILKMVLGSNTPVTESVASQNLSKRYQGYFDPFEFNCAFQVIAVYCGSLDEELIGGTGLQPIV